MTAPAGLSGVEELTPRHDASRFDCGVHSLNEYIRRFAFANQRGEFSKTYVVHRGGMVAGYYTLAPGAVMKHEAPGRIFAGCGDYPSVGVILLARLAVDQGERGKGLGAALLKDALKRSSHAADIISARAVLVHALDENARAFYEHFGSDRSPSHELHLMLLMKDLRKMLRAASR